MALGHFDTRRYLSGDSSYGFVTNVERSKLNHLNWPFVPSVTTTPLLKSAAMTRPLAKILDTLFNSIVSSISLTF